MLYISSYENYVYNKIINQNGPISQQKKYLVEVGLSNIGIDGGNDNLLSESLEKKFNVKRDFNSIMHHRLLDFEFYSQQIQEALLDLSLIIYITKIKNIYILKVFHQSTICFFNSIIQIYYLYLSFIL